MCFRSVVQVAFNYPNGMPFPNNEGNSIKKQEKNQKKSPQFANRGMNFEEEINQSNLYYLNRNLAVIHKKPTPLKIVKVDYPRRSAAVITEAYFNQASTTDYNGVYDGYYLDFEAKETKNKTSFPLKNFHEHQINHMKQCIQQKGVCFVLVWFSTLNKCFLLGANHVITSWENQKMNQRKSISFQTFETTGYEIKLAIAPRIPYLKAVDDYISKEIQYG